MALRARRAPVVSGREEMLNAQGQVLEVEGSEAWAQVRGERWAVVSELPLATGQRVRVTGIRGLTLQVQPEPESSATHGGTR